MKYLAARSAMSKAPNRRRPHPIFVLAVHIGRLPSSRCQLARRPGHYDGAAGEVKPLADFLRQRPRETGLGRLGSPLHRCSSSTSRLGNVRLARATIEARSHSWLRPASRSPADGTRSRGGASQRARQLVEESPASSRSNPVWPSRPAWTERFGSTMRVICVRGAGKARVMHTPVHTRRRKAYERS